MLGEPTNRSSQTRSAAVGNGGKRASLTQPQHDRILR